MIRRAILAAATAAALLLAPTAASAAIDIPPWTTDLTCASGDITNTWVGQDDLDRPATWLSGSIVPCGAAAESDRYAFVYYVQDREAPGPQGYVIYPRLRPYGPGGTVFAGTIDPDVALRSGPVIAVCLAWGPGRLLDCVQPDPSTTGGQPRPPLPPIEALAPLPVTLVDFNGTEPNCATCV